MSDCGIFSSGSFVTGCNYWASHAGTAMWSDWRPEVVREDMRRLSAAGLKVLRVFPLWPDFQPLKMHYGVLGSVCELRMGDDELPWTEAGRAGVSEQAMGRFREFADMALEHSLSLSVGLVTGWMSGRMFVPPAFERLNVISDPLALKWQVRFIRYFVKTFKDHPAIVAWGPGNECNCMGKAESREEAWVWMNSICAAIRQEDSSRPILSGMHSLRPAPDCCDTEVKWTIQDQAELSDMLTTHPYPKFTPYAGIDPLNRIKNCFHATAESRLYADIGGKPCIAEELGTLAAMLAGEKEKAAYVRNALFNLWAHDCRALIWWCAFDQLHLEHTPYDWTAFERELGLFKAGYEAKPVLREFTEFQRFVDSLPFDRLPLRRSEALCLLTDEQDCWANAWSSFILAKQAGFDVEFAYAKDEFREADFYLLPGLDSARGFNRSTWLRLIEKVRDGATLYVSLDRGLLAPFEEVFGVRACYQERRSGKVEFSFDGEGFAFAAEVFQVLEADGAEVLAVDGEGHPVFLRHCLGAGEIYLLLVPMERVLASTPGAFHGREALPCHRIYRRMAEPLLSGRIVRSDEPVLSLTEHMLSGDRAVVVAVNNQPEALETRLKIASGWRCVRALRGNAPETGLVRVSGNDALVLEFELG